MPAIVCYDHHGNAHQLAEEDVQFRPAVYGIFIEEKQVLLLRHPETDLWYPPGAILEPHQTPTQTIRHYFRQVIGLIPELGPLLCVEDHYVYDSGQQRGWQVSAIYYALKRPSANTTPLAEWEGAPHPEYVPLDGLKREQLQFGYEAIMAGGLGLRS